MNTIDALFVVVIIIVIFMIYRPDTCQTVHDKIFSGKKEEEGEMPKITPEVVENITSERDLHRATHGTLSDYEGRKKRIEGESLKENLESFNNLDELSCRYNCDDKNDYAAQAYIENDISYNDVMTRMGVTEDVFDNHRNFVEDGGPLRRTGPTYTPDFHSGYDPIPWQGLRRPQNVPVGDPDQLPDIDRDLYENEPSIRF